MLAVADHAAGAELENVGVHMVALGEAYPLVGVTLADLPPGQRLGDERRLPRVDHGADRRLRLAPPVRILPRRVVGQTPGGEWPQPAAGEVVVDLVGFDRGR